MSEKKNVFFLDAFALIFRGYYAMIKNPRINSKGMDTSAILGFTNSLLDIFRREDPKHLVVVFDKGGSKERTKIFKEYKANRAETPEAIKIAIPYIKKILQAMGISFIEKEGYEADDLIGTLSKQAEKEGFKVYMVTPDKDYAQLVSENVFMYRPSRMGNGIEIWGVDEVKEKFGIKSPLQVIDYLAMVGDAVDNIPGFPGVGDKTAKKFINAYGSIEGLFEHIEQVKGKLKEKIQTNKEMGFLSKRLVTIMLDCPVTFEPSQISFEKIDFEKIRLLMEELEFKRALQIIENIFLKGGKPFEGKETTHDTSAVQLDLFSDLSPDTDPDTQKHTAKPGSFYQYVNTSLASQLLSEYLLRQKEVAICFFLSEKDVEDSLEIFGIGFSYQKQKGYYVPLRGNFEQKKAILQVFQPFFENEAIQKIGDSLKECIKILKLFDIDLKGELFDIALAHYVLHPDMSHQIKRLSQTFLKRTILDSKDLFGSGKNKLHPLQVPLSLQMDFATSNAEVCLSLKQLLEEQLKREHLQNLYRELEIPLLKVLAKMELEGICLNVEKLSELSSEITAEVTDLENKIYNICGEKFNISSPKQLGEMLFDKLKLIDNPKKTKSGQYATGEDILSKLSDKHPIIPCILQHRTLVKLKSTYVDALPKEVSNRTGRIHTTYMQTVASTGRLSSHQPNLQNIPIRTEKGRQIRACFTARDDNYTLLAADYSQIELRLIAALSGEETMLGAFKNREDIHRDTASKLFKIPLKEVTKSQRIQAKAVNFGILYGQGAVALSQQTGITKTEAKNLIDTYYTTYPKLKAYITNQVEKARIDGYVTTLLGRKRYLHNIHSVNDMVRSADERNAVNTPIQGSAADLIKKAMIAVDKVFSEKKLQTKMLLQVHDELVFDVPKHEMSLVKPLIRTVMEGVTNLSVKLEVDMGEGQTWLAAH